MTHLNGFENKELILADISKLQLCHYIDVLDSACGLFLEKWVKDERAFVRYFQRQWLKDGTKNWFEGIGPFIPSTNNALESTNKRIKDDFNLRHRCSLTEFRARILSMMERYSDEYITGKRLMTNIINIDKEIWLKGREWAKSAKIPYPKNRTAENNCYYIPAGDELSVSRKAVQVYEKLLYDSFDQFPLKYFEIWMVMLPKDMDSIADARCTCPSFFKRYMCKHIVGMCLRMKIFEFPSNYRQVETIRGRGRPKKIGLALLHIIYQHNY